MNLSAVSPVRLLTAGIAVLVWLPVITRPRAPWLPSIVVSAALLLLLAWHWRRARANPVH